MPVVAPPTSLRNRVIASTATEMITKTSTEALTSGGYLVPPDSARILISNRSHLGQTMVPSSALYPPNAHLPGENYFCLYSMCPYECCKCV